MPKVLIDINRRIGTKYLGKNWYSTFWLGLSLEGVRVKLCEIKMSEI